MSSALNFSTVGGFEFFAFDQPAQRDPHLGERN